MVSKQVQKFQQAELAMTPEAISAQFAHMGNLIPETESDDGGLSIIGQLLGATSLDELSQPWAEKDQEALVDHELIIESVTRSPSDFAGGLGVFLVCKAYDATRDERVTFTTGSMSVVAQLVMVYTLDKFPVSCTLRKAKKASKAGFFPQHLEFAKGQ